MENNCAEGLSPDRHEKSLLSHGLLGISGHRIVEKSGLKKAREGARDHGGRPGRYGKFKISTKRNGRDESGWASGYEFSTTELNLMEGAGGGQVWVSAFDT